MGEEKKRPVKRLVSAKRSGAYQKDNFLSIRPQVEAGKPMAYFGAMTPIEIFRAMDIPYVVQPWWMGIVNAKQQADKMHGYMRDAGYREDLCSYCSMALACACDPRPEEGPWGGLPNPSIIIGGTYMDCSSSIKMDQLVADRYGAKIHYIQSMKHQNLPDNWWELTEDHWEELVGKERLDHYENEVRKMATFLEEVTGQPLDKNKLIEVLNNVNEQEYYNKMVRNLVSNTKPAPAVISDTINAVQQAQWLRGTEWAREHAKKFYEEVKELADNGIGAVPDEKVRLMWVGRGLWFDMSFYQHFEEKYGAAFIWTMYLGLGAVGYPRHHPEENPFRCIASRIAIIEDFLHNPKFLSQWYVHEAVEAQIDGVVFLVPENCMNNGDFAYNLIHDFEAAGIPVCPLRADAGDAKTWTKDSMIAAVEQMIDTRIVPKMKD